MENILINFEANTSGLNEVYSGLDKLQEKEQQLKKQIQDADKAYQQYVYDYQKGGKTIVQVEADMAAARAKHTRDSAAARNELKATTNSIADLSKRAKELEDTVAKGVAVPKLTTQMRALRDELAKLEMEGGRGSARWTELSLKAAKLQDQIGDTSRQVQILASDTRNLDAAMGVGQGLVGTFSIAQSGMALLGGQSEELQKTFFKVQAAMQLLNGVQMVANVLNKDSIASVVIRNALSKKTVVNETAEAAATTRSGIAVGIKTVFVKIATGVQWLWNAAIAANPVFWLIAGVVALVAAITWLIASQKTELELQTEINELEKLHIDQLQRKDEVIKRVSDERVKQLTRELNLLKARGASEAELALKQADLNKAELDAATQRAENHKQDIDNLNENLSQQEYYYQRLDFLRSRKAAGDSKGTFITVDGKEVEGEIDEVIENIQGKLGNLTANINVAVDTNQALLDAQAKIDTFNAEQLKKAADAARRSASAAAEYRVLLAKKGSEEELKEREKAINVARNNELSNVNLTLNERRLIIAKAEKDIEQLRRDYATKQLQITKNIYEQQQALAKTGSQDELDLKVKALEVQRDIELQNIELTATQRLLLEQKFQKDAEQLRKEFNSRQTQNELNAQIAALNVRLSYLREGSREELSIRTDLLEKQAELERQAVAISTETEELKAAKIFAINEKLQADIDKMKREAAKKQADFELSTAKQQLDLERVLAEQEATTGFFGKMKSRETLANIRARELAAEKDMLDSNYAAGLISEQQFQEGLTDLVIQGEQDRLQAEMEAEEARKAIMQATFDLANELGNTLYEAKKARLDQELADLQHYYTTDIEEAKKNANLKLISEEEMARRELEIKRKQAKTEKEQAIFNVILNTIQGVAKALGSAPPPYNLILAAITAAAGAVQLAKVSSKPLPTYWKGRKGGQGEYAMVGEHGPEVMYIPEGASILPAHHSHSVASALNAMPAFNMPIPVMPSISEKLLVRDAALQVVPQPIDYNRLGKAVADNVKIPETKQLYVTIDEGGIKKHLQQGKDVTISLNKNIHW